MIPMVAVTIAREDQKNTRHQKVKNQISLKNNLILKPHKKYVASLPPNFQEVLMSSEMELQQGLNVQILRKLVYLYTRGMQYYDLIHKDKFRQFYSDKLVSLLTRKPVEKFLDENPINFEDKDDLDLLFDSKEKKENEEENNIKNEINYEMRDFSSQIRKN